MMKDAGFGVPNPPHSEGAVSFSSLSLFVSLSRALACASRTVHFSCKESLAIARAGLL